MTKDPLIALREHFGFRKFLHGQESIISAILGGQDALVVMPTGGGKSLCYQLPAVVMEGVTIVVSPLIALMKDQVDALTAKGIPATMINSAIGYPEQQERLRKLREGAYRLVYIAPERFRNETFTRTLSQVPIALFAVDEAHCLSQWGHDFRPDYIRLGEALAGLGRPQTVALTATATPQVRKDILQHLGLANPFQCVTGFERPNLSITIQHIEKTAQKYQRLKEILREHQTGIIYCATRKQVEEVTDHLHHGGIPVMAYHGGMSDEDREKAQNLFIKRKRQVAVATNAFGMGIDRPDVRFVVHFDVPGSVEAYYQEAGRAGRDGEPAVCELLFNYADTRTQEFFIDGNNPGADVIRQVYLALQHAANAQHEAVLPIKDLAARAGVKNSMSVSTTLSILAKAHYIQRYDIPGQRQRGTRLLHPTAGPFDLQLDWEALREKERRDREKLKAMVQLCYSTDCRQQSILRYFGEENAGLCGTCDRCRRSGGRRFRPPNEEEKLIVRKALSGVARMSRKTAQGWEGRYGRGRIVQMLVGSRSQEVLNARLDELSTYGILKSTGTAYLNALFRELQENGLLVVSPGEYPLMTLTSKGDDVMHDRIAWQLRWPDAPSTASASTSAATVHEPHLEEMGFDRHLFESLKKKRSELASAAKVPPYIIFPDATLEFFTRLRPTTTEAALTIRGVGPAKAESYLPHFLDVIRSHVAAEPISTSD